MANNSHLVLKQVKTKKGGYVARWVDPTSGKKGPKVGDFQPPGINMSQAAGHIKAQIVALAKEGKLADIEKLSLGGLHPADQLKLEKLKEQAAEFIEQHKQQAADHIADPEAPVKPVVPKPDLPTKSKAWAKVSHRHHYEGQLDKVHEAIKNLDAPALQALKDHHQGKNNAYMLSEEEPTPQASTDAGVDGELALMATVGLAHVHKHKPALDAYHQAAAKHAAGKSAAVGMTPPQPAGPKKAAVVLTPAGSGKMTAKISDPDPIELPAPGGPKPVLKLPHPASSKNGWHKLYNKAAQKQHDAELHAWNLANPPSVAAAQAAVAKLDDKYEQQGLAGYGGSMTKAQKIAIGKTSTALKKAGEVLKAAQAKEASAPAAPAKPAKKSPSLADKLQKVVNKLGGNLKVAEKPAPTDPAKMEPLAALGALAAQLQQPAAVAAAAAGQPFKAPVDTAKWPQHNTAAIGATKKVALIEQLANAGDLVSLHAMALPIQGKKMNSYGKGVLAAHAAAVAHVTTAKPAAVQQAAAAVKPWTPPVPVAEQKEAAKVVAPFKKAAKPAPEPPKEPAAEEPKQGPGVVVGNLCRDEKGHFIPCSLPGAKPVHENELPEQFVLGIDTSSWKQGHSSVVQAQKKMLAIQALANAGDLDGLMAAQPKFGASPNNYQKKTAQAHALAVAYLQAKQHQAQVAIATTPEPPIPVPGPAAPVAEQPAPEPATPAAAAAKEHADASQWTKVGGQLGSNPGAVMTDENGVKHYVKYSKSNDHARNEVLAARLYQLAGVGVVDYQLVSTKPGTLGTATTWTDTQALPLTPGSAGLLAAQADFAVHAWLSNWDAVGMGFDNLKVGPDGQPMCVDTGGALLYRAQGSPKGQAFGRQCTEWDTMRSVKHNAQTAAVFGTMTSEQLVAAVGKLEAIDNQLIYDAIVNHGPGTKAQRELLAAKMIQRKADLVSKKAALVAATPTAAPAPAPVPEPTPEPSWNAPAEAAEPAPAAVAPAFPSPLTEAMLSSKTNPLNAKLWAKKLQIDATVHGFASGTLTAEQALASLDGMQFGVQTYQKKVATYHAMTVVGLQMAAQGAVAAPPAATGTQPLPAPAAPVVVPAAPAPTPAPTPAPAPLPPDDIAAQTAAALKFPALDWDKLPKTSAATDAHQEIEQLLTSFKTGKVDPGTAFKYIVSTIVPVPAQDVHLPAAKALSAYKKQVLDTLENYEVFGIDYDAAKAAFSLAWSGAPGHRKHAQPDAPTAPVHLVAKPDELAPFKVPAAPDFSQSGLTPGTKLKLNTMLDQALQVEGGHITPDSAIDAITAVHVVASTPAAKQVKAYQQQLLAELKKYDVPGPEPVAPAPAPVPAAPAVPAPKFEIPKYLTAGQKTQLGTTKLDQYELIEALLAGVAAGDQDVTDAKYVIAGLPNLKSGTLAKWKGQAQTALTAYTKQLEAHQVASQPTPAYAPLPADAPAATPPAAPAKGKKEKKKPVFDPSKLAQPINFLAWGDTGKPGPSGSIHYNQANHNAARLIYKTAQAGDPEKLKNLKVMVPNKDTGANIGDQVALNHPSKWVSGYAQQLLNEIDAQLNPVEEFRFGDDHPLSALSSGLPSLPTDKIGTAKKIGYYLNLGSAKTSLVAANGGKMPTAKELVGGTTHKFNDAALNSSTYTSQTQPAWAKMPDQQKKAIKAYTGPHSGSINDSMWKGNPNGQAKSAQEALLTLGHEIKPGTLLSRKMHLSSALIAQLKQSVGSVIQEPAINSTAINPDIWGGNVQLKLHVGPGVKGLYVGPGSLGGSSGISSHVGEWEMMLPGNYRMLITEVTEPGAKDADGFGGGGMTVVHAVILPNH